jgi:ubiquinone/menaquinone biosynthesis C-methylase UbiE
MNELDEVRERFERRKTGALAQLYDPFRTVNLLLRQDKERAWNRLMARWLKGRTLSSLNIAEVGCGGGMNLLYMLSLGADPARITANELLADRLAASRHNLPAAVTFLPGDASKLPIADGSLDLVIQSTVFSSILDKPLRQAVADRIMAWLKPGGCLLWYDFTFDNPKNPDVQGITLSSIRAMFPGAAVTAKRVTLAPPLARRLGALTPIAYPLLNLAPFLRTHVACTIEKPAA